MLVVALFGAPVPFGLMAWFVFVVAPTFTRMFADFGAELPSFTQLVISPWWGPGMIATYLLAVPATFGLRRNVERDFAMVLVVIAGLLVVMASTACLYLPMFQMSQQLQ